MNERIKELYNQSLEAKYQYGGSDAKPGEMYSNYITVLNTEKFAELLVRDTLDQVAEFGRLTRAYQTQGIDPEIDVAREVLKNYGFTRFPRC